MLKGAAWAAPVVAVTVSTPLAAATLVLDTDIRLSFRNTTVSSTYDVTLQVVDFIVDQVAPLGPQMPPGEPPRPRREDFTGPWAELQYTAAMTQYGVQYGIWAAQNAEAIAQAVAWQLAVAELRNTLERFADLGRMIFEVKVTYPRELTAMNYGPNAVAPGTPVSAIVTAGTGNISFPTGSQTVSVVSPGAAANTVVFNEPLQFFPTAITVIANGQTYVESSITATLLSPDTDDAGNIVTAVAGIQVSVLGEGFDAVRDEWEDIMQRIEQLRDLWEIIGPIVGDIDWGSIIGGMIPVSIPALPSP